MEPTPSSPDSSTEPRPALARLTREDRRYWRRRPRDHAEDGLFRDGPHMAACRVWEMAGAVSDGVRRKREQEQIEREAEEVRRAKRRAQPAPRLPESSIASRCTTRQQHPRACKRLLVPVHQARRMAA